MSSMHVLSHKCHLSEEKKHYHQPSYHPVIFPKMLIRFLGSCTITSRSRCRPTTRASSLIAPQSPELLGSSGASDLHFAGPHRFDQTRSIGCPEDVPGNKQPGRPKGAKPRSIHSATREAAQQSPSNCRPEARDKELPTGTRRKRMSKPCQSSRTWIRCWFKKKTQHVVVGFNSSQKHGSIVCKRPCG